MSIERMPGAISDREIFKLGKLPKPTLAKDQERWFAEDLAAASPEGLTRLWAERGRLPVVEAAHQAAKQAHEAAKQAAVEVRIAGGDEAAAQNAIDDKHRDEYAAHSAVDLTKNVIAEMERRLVAEVRDARAAVAQRALDTARDAYDRALPRVRDALAAIEVMAAAQQAESEAAAALALARREEANGLFSGIQPSDGSRHRSITAVLPSIVIGERRAETLADLSVLERRTTS